MKHAQILALPQPGFKSRAPPLAVGLWALTSRGRHVLISESGHQSWPRPHRQPNVEAWEPKDLGSNSGLSILLSLSFPICKRRKLGQMTSGSFLWLKHIEFLPGSEATEFLPGSEVTVGLWTKGVV